MLRGTTITGLFACAALLLGLTNVASAHFPWLVIDRENPGEPVLHCYFGEGPIADDPSLLSYVEKAKVYRVPARGETTKLELKTGDDSLMTALDAGQGEAVVALKHSLGVMNRGDSTFLLNYYGKTGPAVTSWQWQRAKTDEIVRLDADIESEEGELTITAELDGKPVPNAEVVLYYANGEEQKQTANEKGKLTVSLTENGLEAIRLKAVEAESGSLDDKQYTEIRHYTTLTFPALTHIPVIAETSLPDIPEAVTSFGAAVVDNNLFVYGGHTGNAHEYWTEGHANTLWTLPLKQGGTWKSLGTGPRLQGLAMVGHNGKLYRIGGFTARNKEGEEHDLWSQADVECFDIESQEWTSLPDLPEPRSSFDAAVLGDHIYVIGGWTMQGEGETEWLDTAYALNLKSSQPAWEKLPPAPFKRRAISVAAHDGKLYVIGGMRPQGGPTTQVAIYDPAAGAWSEGPSLIGSGMTGFGTSSFAQDGRLYASTYDGTLQRLSEDGESWELLGHLERARFFHRMLPVGENKLLFVGGSNMSIGKFTELDIVTLKN